jgi:hypothetical protein
MLLLLFCVANDSLLPLTGRASQGFGSPSLIAPFPSSFFSFLLIKCIEGEGLYRNWEGARVFGAQWGNGEYCVDRYARLGVFLGEFFDRN